MPDQKFRTGNFSMKMFREAWGGGGSLSAAHPPAKQTASGWKGGNVIKEPPWVLFLYNFFPAMAFHSCWLVSPFCLPPPCSPALLHLSLSAFKLQTPSQIQGSEACYPTRMLRGLSMTSSHGRRGLSIIPHPTAPPSLGSSPTLPCKTLQASVGFGSVPVCRSLPSI